MKKLLKYQQPRHSYGVDFKSPAAAPSIAVKAGVFGEDCLRLKAEFRSRPLWREAQEISGRG